MSVEVTMPKFGLTMSEANIVKWLKKEGDPIRTGEALLEIETEKVLTEIESPASGIVEKILQPEGTAAPVGAAIAYIRAEGQ